MQAYHTTRDGSAARVAGRSADGKRRTYYTVDQNATIFHSYFCLEFELSTQLAGAVCRFPELEAKCQLSHHLHSGMLRARDLRARLVDFNLPHAETRLQPRWTNLVRHLLAAPDEAALLSALYRVVRPAQLRCYELHASTTLPVNDAPSQELLEMHLPALRRDIDWGQEYLARQERAGRSGDPGFEEALREHLRALGGPMGVNPPADAATPPRFPAWRRPRTMALEPRFQIRSADRYTLPDWPEYEAIPSAYTHFTELPVIDIVGTIVADGRSLKLPFEFFLEFTRQLWDEARHTTMGFERLQAFGVDPYGVPIPVGHFTVWANLKLLHRLASLTQVGEACSFAPKRQWVKHAWDRQDPLSALEHEYDIVDERMHVRFGARWIPEIMKLTKDERTVKQVVQDADWEFRERINKLRKKGGESWAKDLGQRFMGCGTDTSPVSLAPALDGIPNIIA